MYRRPPPLTPARSFIDDRVAYVGCTPLTRVLRPLRLTGPVRDTGHPGPRQAVAATRLERGNAANTRIGRASEREMRCPDRLARYRRSGGASGSARVRLRRGRGRPRQRGVRSRRPTDSPSQFVHESEGAGLRESWAARVRRAGCARAGRRGRRGRRGQPVPHARPSVPHARPCLAAALAAHHAWLPTTPDCPPRLAAHHAWLPTTPDCPPRLAAHHA
jgi:hypothetical protein